MAINKRVGGALATAFMCTMAGTAVPAMAEPADDKPVIYLSFDDGPSSDDGTTSLLDVLEDYDAQATFFVNGSNVVNQRDPSVKSFQEATLRRILADGHALGNHSFQHVELKLIDDPVDVGLQVSLNHEYVLGVTGHDMTCFRSPWGSTWTESREIEIIESYGYQIENYWSDNDASEYIFEDLMPEYGENPTDDQRADRIRRMAPMIAAKLATARDGEVFLMHDGANGKSATVAGVALFLSEHGDEYDFRAIPGCGGATVTTPPTPTPTPPTPTPPPAGPTFSGPISQASSIAEVLAASDYRPADADYLRLYHALLARDPDIEGSQYWLTEARKGVDLDAVAWSFAQSVEFQTKYGALTDDQFVITVYSNVLDRAPDAEGRDYWLGEVRSGRLSRHGVVRWMAESPEFRLAHPYNPS